VNNLLVGLIVLLCASIGYFYSWRFHKKGQYIYAIVLMIVSALGLYFYVSADFFLHFWDERYHALVAKNLVNHPLVPTLYDNPVLPYNYQNWSANHIWVHKQPLPLWSIAISLWVFGINEIAVRLPSIFLTSTAIYLVFSVGSYLFNQKTGYLAAFLFSINGLLISLVGGRTATDHIDVFFMFFVLLSVYFSIQYIQKEKTIFSFLVGISIGFAILSKWLPALIVLPIWLLLVWDSKQFNLKTIITQFVFILISLAAIFLPWQFYIFSVFPKESLWESSHHFKHLFEELDGHSTTIFYFLNRIRTNYGEYIYLPLAWFIWKVFQDLKNKKRLSVLIWFLIPFLFFSMAKTRMQGYILFTAPALFFMTAEFFYSINKYKDGHRFKWIFNIVMVLIILLPIRYSIERMKVFEIKDRSPQWVLDLKDLNKKNIKNGVLFNYNRPIEAMFYTSLTVYHNVPKKKIISDLSDQGYTILINDDGEVPSKILGMKQVTKVGLTKAIDD